MSDDWILHVGTYPPRECGIATFTEDLKNAVHGRFPTIKAKICAMNKNSTDVYNYPKEVLFTIDDGNIQQYIDVAHKINAIEEIKLVHIQHEFGIFGGEYGSYLIAFLEVLEKPITITFHSVLPEPNDILKLVVQNVTTKAKSIIVMTPVAVEILMNQYDLKTDIAVFPHGIPSVPFTSTFSAKRQLGLANRTVLSSFGLVSSGKGYEFVIDALPDVVEKNPDVLYLIFGETHPVVRKQEGESYRNFLEEKVKELGLQNHVKFYNKYLDLQEIVTYLRATDLYISSGQEPRQITSGTLAYAMGCGRPVVSTPFLHAQDMVRDNRGKLAEFDDVESFSEAISSMVADPIKMQQWGWNAYYHTRHMTWPNVGLAYMDLFRKHIEVSAEEELPVIKLDHMRTLTDDFGIIQFAKITTPDIESGYTLDDNARALIVAGMSYQESGKTEDLDLINKYVDFIEHITQNGKYFNYVNGEKRINMTEWTDDAHGRALWALGYVSFLPSIPREIREKVRTLFNCGLAVMDTITSPRSVAYAIIGLCYFNRVSYAPENVMRIRKFADHLISIYFDHSSEDWQWFEPSLSYANSKLSEALFYAYQVTMEERYLTVAEKSLKFLTEISFENGVFNAIGQNGWFIQNGRKAYYDQQPVCTAAMVQTFSAAYHVTKNKLYAQNALTAFKWFLGLNALRQMMYNELSSGCHDGLGEVTVNMNQGAESTISYLLARLTIEELKNVERKVSPLPEIQRGVS